jgi:hypothetical protein
MTEIESIRPDDPRVATAAVHRIDVGWMVESDQIVFAFRDEHGRQRAAMSVQPEAADRLADDIRAALATRAERSA